MELIFLNALLVGAAILLWLLIRALPRVDQTLSEKSSILDRWLTSELPARIDAYTHAAFMRILRRVKVFVLRLDNGINQKLQRMKLERGEGIKAPKINLKKVLAERIAKDKEDKKKD